jgi:hypothetical protein
MLCWEWSRPQTLASAEEALRSKPGGSQHRQISVQIQTFILRLVGYKILVGTDLLVGGRDRWTG